MRNPKGIEMPAAIRKPRMISLAVTNVCSEISPRSVQSLARNSVGTGRMYSGIPAARTPNCQSSRSAVNDAIGYAKAETRSKVTPGGAALVGSTAGWAVSLTCCPRLDWVFGGSGREHRGTARATRLAQAHRPQFRNRPRRAQQHRRDFLDSLLGQANQRTGNRHGSRSRGIDTLVGAKRVGDGDGAGFAFFDRQRISAAPRFIQVAAQFVDA